MKEWFIRGREPKEHCTIHRAFRVTAEDGMTQDRVFEIFPPEYQAWATNERIPQPPAGAEPIVAVISPITTHNSIASSNLRSAIRNTQSFRILSPLPGDIFKIDPVLRPEYQAIRIEAAIPQRYADVKLVVNKKEELSLDGNGVWWTLKKGSQRMQLMAKDGRRVVFSKSVTVEVH